jgi:TIR domain
MIPSISDFRYEVAISFAGEQRREAEQLAKCLRDNNVSVFYDAFEEAQLWGKDLFEHLSDVYSRQAKYCIILASQSYAEKAWTTHERISAQARALQEKGNEYILPVRFDQTPIPGLNSTIGYLDFQRYGIEGICNAFIRKLRGPQSGAGIQQVAACSSSSLAAIFVAEKDILLFVPVLHSSFGQEKAQFVVVPDEPDDEHHLNSLKRIQNLVIVAYKHDVAVCKVANVVFHTTAGVGQFELGFEVLQMRFKPDMEVGLSSTSKDQLAEERTRRLLLNENPAKPKPNMNEMMREVLVAGQGTLSQVKKSRFPDLYAHYRSNSRRFLEAAWIDTMLILKTSACVADVEKLTLKLVDSHLEVDFSGRRENEYLNKLPYEISVHGRLTLI